MAIGICGRCKRNDKESSCFSPSTLEWGLREDFPRRPPACEDPEHAACAAEEKGRHRAEPIAQFPAGKAAEIDADENAELHA